ncbi:hypothetical protein, partial [Longibacter sp.]|uniref:hypothetical protein n=1 Tax=Longibacter sp. TaxID=2045415 RepID=UPI003EBD25C6
MSESNSSNLFQGDGGAPDLPDTSELEGGLSIDRVFSSEGEHPFDSCEWETRDASISNPSGDTIFEQKDVEFPAHFSQLSTNIVASKYFYGDNDKGNG